MKKAQISVPLVGIEPAIYPLRARTFARKISLQADHPAQRPRGNSNLKPSVRDTYCAWKNGKVFVSPIPLLFKIFQKFAILLPKISPQNPGHSKFDAIPS